MLRRLILPALLASVCVAAPASAAQVEYDVNAFVFLKGTAAGSDGDGWGSSSAWEAEIDQLIENIPATDDQDSIVGVPTHHRIFANRLKQDYSLATALGTIAWGCVESGAPTGAPGSVTLTRQGDQFQADVIVAQSLTQARSCTGYSSFFDSIEISPGPVVADFSFPVSELEEKGYYSHTVDEVVPCGEWTIYQTTCNIRMQGSLSISRRSAEPAPEKKPIKKVTAKLLPKEKGAAVKVTCKSACSGKISATAVALKRLKEKQVGQKSFSNPSSAPRRVEVIFGGKGARTVRQRGSVIIDVRSGGQTRSTRVNVR